MMTPEECRRILNQVATASQGDITPHGWPFEFYKAVAATLIELDGRIYNLEQEKYR